MRESSLGEDGLGDLGHLVVILLLRVLIVLALENLCSELGDGSGSCTAGWPRGDTGDL